MMSKYTQLILKELSFQFFEKFIRILLGLIILKKVSNYLGPEDYGSFLFIESTYLLFLGVSLFGFEPVFVKFFVQKRNLEKLIINGIYLSFIISGIFLLISYFFTFYFLDFKYSTYLFVVLLLITLNPLYLTEFYFISKNQIRFISTIKGLVYIICFFLKLISVVNELDLVYFVGILFFEHFLVLLIYSYFFFKKIHFKVLNIEKYWIKLILTKTIYVFLYGLGVNLLSRIDIIMIEKFLSLEDLGNYSASYKLIVFTFFIPNIIATTFYPKIVKSLNDKKLLMRMYFLSFWVSLIVFLFVSVFSNYILDYFYLEKYTNVKQIFKISSFAILLGGLSSVYVKRLYALDLQKKVFFRSIFGIILNVLLNLMLIPNYGILGVCYATIISLFFIEIFYDFLIKELREEHLKKLKSIYKYKWLKEYIS